MTTTTEISTKTIFDANQWLTVELARQLKGKKIATTAPEYHMNKPHVNIFVVGEIMSEWDDAARRPYPSTTDIPDNIFNNFQDYWASYMKPEQIAIMKSNLMLFDNNGGWQHRAHTGIDGCFDTPVFTGSDADREVYYIVLEDGNV